MGNFPKRFDVDELILYGDDLVAVLKDGKSLHVLSQTFEHVEALKSSCDADFNEILRSIEDSQKKLDDCKRKVQEVKSEVSAEAEIDRLRKELDEVLEKERALKAELRGIADEINDLEHRRVSIEEQKLALKKAEQDGLRAEKKLSMYASVTKVIPNVNNEHKISGYMVDRDKRVVEKFEYEATKLTTYDTCNSIWSMINKQ